MQRLGVNKMNSKYLVTMDDGREFTVAARSENEAKDKMQYTADQIKTEVFSMKKIEGAIKP
jgi:hypothetical protein